MARVDLDDYELADRYARREGRVYLTGTQALVRILLDQAGRDRARGLDTAGFVSGYRGSPLGGVDLELWRAKTLLAENRIEFLPAVNEDLAATAVLGSQQVETEPERDGRGRVRPLVRQGAGRRPGRRCAEARQRLRLVAPWRRAGGRGRRSRLRLVLDAAPVGRRVHELVHADPEPGLDRPNTWPSANTATRCRASPACGSASRRSRRRSSPRPRSNCAPPARLRARPNSSRRRAACTTAGPTCPARRSRSGWRRRSTPSTPSPRANPIDRRIYDIPDATFGIVTTGKGHLDLMEALRLLGLDEADCRRLGLDIYKVGMVWPLALHDALDFVRGKREILVVEEKRGIIESQFKEYFYDYPGREARRAWSASTTRRGDAAGALDGRALAAPPGRHRGARGSTRSSPASTSRRGPRGPGAGGRPADPGAGRDAHALFLLGLPAQHLDPGAGGLEGAGRHRLPFHGELDGPRDHLAHPDGRRGRELGGLVALHRARPRLPEPRRGHLLPLGLDGDPPGDRGRHEHHLQDPLQRRGRDDRRPAGRRAGLASRPSRTTVRAEGVDADRARLGRSRESSRRPTFPAGTTLPSPRRRSTPCSASCARSRASRC